MNQKKLIRISMYIISFMIFVAFSSPILYDVFCKATGYNGTIRKITSNDPYSKIVQEATIKFFNERSNKTLYGVSEMQDHVNNQEQKSLKIEFDANVNNKLNWEFYPKVPSIEVTPGSTFLVYFYIKNRSNSDNIGTAIYNISPPGAAQYFVKIQCFCFENIFLKAGEDLTVPVLFYLDQNISSDEETKNTTIMTLSYTFFPSIVAR